MIAEHAFPAPVKLAKRAVAWRHDDVRRWSRWLADHRYVMVLHDHQANPHVHLSLRAESRHGQRLNPREADLQRCRQTLRRSCEPPREFRRL